MPNISPLLSHCANPSALHQGSTNSSKLDGKYLPNFSNIFYHLLATVAEVASRPPLCHRGLTEGGNGSFFRAGCISTGCLAPGAYSLHAPPSPPLRLTLPPGSLLAALGTDDPPGLAPLVVLAAATAVVAPAARAAAIAAAAATAGEGCGAAAARAAAVAAAAGAEVPAPAPRCRAGLVAPSQRAWLARAAATSRAAMLPIIASRDADRCRTYTHMWGQLPAH